MPQSERIFQSDESRKFKDTRNLLAVFNERERYQYARIVWGFTCMHLVSGKIGRMLRIMRG